ncbi:hypothetical protein Sjap_011108 [Stephania japonica]|uniref:Spen paralogue and orthologue SPOC C-terminal domain-containing protein n=1 Tax=Stephania japonica TaxID=461633 RepID=A0AAP0JCQ4_9MAGN
MVTSLCWKVGSSEAGLNGMKQVAKRYKDGGKVGFAQLSPGIDLYVCPRSDTIITILAKYGFFKGMAAIEDDKDSLIGCFVWRRHRSSLDTVSKKQNKVKLPLAKKSPNSNTEISTITPLNADAREKVDGSLTTGSRIRSDAPESAISQNVEGNNIQSIQATTVVSNVAVNMKLAPSVPDSSLAVSRAHQADVHSNSNNLKCYGRLEAYTALINNSSEKEKTTSQLMGSLPFQPDYFLKQNKHIADDDDDLPEYDFSIECGISHTVQQTIVTNQSKSVAASGTASLGMEPTMPHMVQQTIVTNHSKSDAPSFSNRLETNQRLPPQSKQWEERTMLLPFYGERLLSTQSEMISNPSVCILKSNNFIHLKNRWDDDDDMPEWYPPDFCNRDHLPGMPMVKPSVPTVPPFFPNSTTEKKPLAPPMSTQIQTFPHGKQNYFVSAEEHVKFGPRSLLECNSSSSFVSFPYNFDG